MNVTEMTEMVTIDDRSPVPDGKHPAGLRVLAMLGKDDSLFGGNGEQNDLPRAALMWTVRLPCGSLGSMTHLVTLDPSPNSLVRRLAAALLGIPELQESGHLDNGGRLLGRSCLLAVKRQRCGDRDRPTVVGSMPLPAGIDPVPVLDPLLWTPKDDLLRLPPWVPCWVRGYANIVARVDREVRHGQNHN